MTQMTIVEPRLQWFVEQMKAKLSMPKNTDRKGDWRDANISDLLDKLEHEILELKDELQAMRDEEAIKECADVANFAMMIADLLNYRLKLSDLKYFVDHYPV